MWVILHCSWWNKKKSRNLEKQRWRSERSPYNYVVEGLMYSCIFPEAPKMIRETWASQRTLISFAFLRIPFFLLEYVTCLLLEFSILLISILPLPISHKLSQPFSSLFSLYPFCFLITAVNEEVGRKRGYIASTKKSNSGAFHYGFVDEQLSQWHRKKVFV